MNDQEELRQLFMHDLLDDLKELHEEIDRLKKVLEWYAEQKNYEQRPGGRRPVLLDRGGRAQMALGKVAGR